MSAELCHKQNHMTLPALHVLIFNNHIDTLFPPLCIFCKNVNHCQCQNRSPTLWIYSQHSQSLCLFLWPHSSQRCPRLCCKFHHRMRSATTNNTLPQPIKISVHLADEWTGFLPIVHVAPNHKLTQSEILNPISFSPLVHAPRFSLFQAMFLFLPLPFSFESTDVSHWQRLTKMIESCLVASTTFKNRHPEAYCVMQDLFWMAFVASFPTFPGGDWPLWDAQISMKEGFISSWVHKEEVEEISFVQQAIWVQFKTTVKHMLSIPVVL